MPANPKQDIPPPDDFATQEEFVEWIRRVYDDDIDYDKINRSRGQEDSEFAASYQWAEEDLRRRQEQNAPSLTFNRIFSLFKKKMASRTRIRVGPRVLPETDGEQYEEIAKIREGITRNIERNSDIGAVDAIVSQNQFIAGVGCYDVAVDYANADVFEYDIFIRSVFDPFSVVWDRLSTEPTGRDARHCVLHTYMDKEDFKKAYPNAQEISFDGAGQNTWWTFSRRKISITGWLSDKAIRVATVWRMRERKRTLALLTNGDVVPLPDGTSPKDFAMPTGSADGGLAPPVTVALHPQTGEYIVRESPVKYCEGYITNGLEILKGPFELPIDRVPLIRVPGWMIPIGDRVERFSAVSFAKDAIRFYNYVRSDRIERIIFRPRFSWIANEDEVRGREALWTNAHLARNQLGLHAGPSGGGPRQLDPPQVDQASILETQTAVQDIMDVFDTQQPAQPGQTPTTASALEMLQSASDGSNVVFDEMYFAAKREVYRTVNQLIPHVYDTPRVVKVVGEDDKLKTAILNNPENPESMDLTLGKYAVSIDIGPSVLTKRAQSIELIKTMINAAPDAAAIVFDKLIELQNIQGGDVLARRWRERFNIKDEETPTTPEEIAAMEQAAQLQQQQLEMEMQLKQAELDLKLADVGLRQAEIGVRQAEIAAREATVESENSQSVERIARAESERVKAAAFVEAQQVGLQKTQAEIALIKAKVEAEYERMLSDEETRSAERAEKET